MNRWVFRRSANREHPGRIGCPLNKGRRPVTSCPGMWMLRTRLLCAIGVSLWSAAVIVGGQTVPPGALSGALRDHEKNERFQIVTSIRGLPLGVRGGLQTL